jgi:hypothetical protein
MSAGAFTIPATLAGSPETPSCVESEELAGLLAPPCGALEWPSPFPLVLSLAIVPSAVPHARNHLRQALQVVDYLIAGAGLEPATPAL